MKFGKTLNKLSTTTRKTWIKVSFPHKSITSRMKSPPTRAYRSNLISNFLLRRNATRKNYFASKWNVSRIEHFRAFQFAPRAKLPRRCVFFARISQTILPGHTKRKATSHRFRENTRPLIMAAPYSHPITTSGLERIQSLLEYCIPRRRFATFAFPSTNLN